MSVTAVIQHHVADYSAWRKVYDEVADLQTSGGVLSKSVHRGKDDANVVLVQHKFATMAAATAFFSNADLKAAMQRAGVQGPPRIELYEDA
jgi:hypothetical protein